MGKKSNNRLPSKEAAAIQVIVEFKVTITEVHSRTGTVCDKRSARCCFEFGNDFEKAKHWLDSDHTLADLGSLSAGACERWAKTPGGRP